jgi:hypothetical protein
VPDLGTNLFHPVILDILIDEKGLVSDVAARYYEPELLYFQFRTSPVQLLYFQGQTALK